MRLGQIGDEVVFATGLGGVGGGHGVEECAYCGQDAWVEVDLRDGDVRYRGRSKTLDG
jgi:hypothetical protein